MDSNNIAIIIGSGLILIVLIVRLVKLKKKFIKKIELLTSLGYALFAYVSGVAIVQMTTLAFLTFTNRITLELILQNKVYVFFAWLIIALGALISYVSLLVENKKPRRKPKNTLP